MTNKHLEEIRMFADEIMEAGLKMQDTAADVAADLIAIAQMGDQYALRSERHQRIIDEARTRVLGGEDRDRVYVDAATKLRDTWPDADGYGVAIVMLRKAVFGEGP